MIGLHKIVVSLQGLSGLLERSTTLRLLRRRGCRMGALQKFIWPLASGDCGARSPCPSGVPESYGRLTSDPRSGMAFVMHRGRSLGQAPEPRDHQSLRPSQLGHQTRSLAASAAAFVERQATPMALRRRLAHLAGTALIWPTKSEGTVAAGYGGAKEGASFLHISRCC